MTPGPRARARRRKAPTPVMDAGETTAPVEETSLAGQPPEPDPTIIDTTATVISEEVQPLVSEPESARTDFYFPPLPRTDQQVERPAASTGGTRRRARGTTPAPAAPSTRRGLLHLLQALARVAQILAVFAATRIKRATLPTFRSIWRFLVHDPYAPPREQPERAILQGHVLGVYRYYRYQRFILGILGGIPLAIAFLYILYLLANEILYGTDGRLFLVQDLAGTFAGFFSSFMLLSLASTRITLRSDGIEYRTMFRVVRSRWEEVSMLKVDYFRRSERWVVGTGRGAWAFLFRSFLGLPKGRQLAKLITIYARLSSTGTPYWLPSLGRFEEGRPGSRSASTTRKAKTKAGAQQQAP